MLGLARTDVACPYEQYLTQLARVALSDKVLTVGERHDLDAVAALPGLSADSVERYRQ